MPRVLRLYYDIVCPYAYLAAARIGDLAAAYSAEVEWRPILLGGLLRAIGAPESPALAMSAPRARLNLLDIHRAADRWGIPLRIPEDHPRRTVAAMRLLVATEGPTRGALTEALYRAYWVEGRDLSEAAVVAEIAREHGVDPAVIASPAAKAGLFAATAAAAEAGAFGVPTITLGDRLWWGQDRLRLVEEALRAEAEAEAGAGGGPSRGRAVTAGPELPQGASEAGTTVDFFHDFASPYAYLAATQIARITAAIPGVTLRWRPILLGALFRDVGTADVPLLELTAVKERYIRRDLEDWAASWGVPFRFPSSFPLRTVLPLRVALVCPEVTLALYHAAWSEGQAIDRPEVLAELLAAAGHAPAELLAAAGRPEIKAMLRENTSEAQRVGCCGVPSMRVLPGDGGPPILLWGQDRLGMLEDVLRGWRPPRG